MRNLLHRPALLLVLALCLVGGVVTLVDRLATGPKIDQNRALLAAEPGINTYPAFSPDGRRIAYSARQGAEKSVFHLFIRPAAPARSGPGPRRLTTADGSDVSPAWSPNGGQIAFLRLQEGRAQYRIIPAGGGAERQLAEFSNPREEAQPAPAVAWTRDGQSLIVVDTGAVPPALVTIPLGGGAPVRLTNPPEQSQGDSTPAVSPDGATLAFVRASGGEGADIYLSDLHGGGLRRLTFDDGGIRGLAWMPGGRDLIYATTRAGAGSQLFRLSAYGGSPHLLALAGTHANFPAVASAAHRLAYADNPSSTTIWRVPLQAGRRAGDPRELIRSTGRESWPAYSPDGRRIVFISDRTGIDEIWISDADGSRPVQASRFLDWPRVAQPRWSPDGASLLFFYDGTLGRGIFTLTRGNLQPKLIALGGTNGSWSHDGSKIYFDAEGRVWRIAADGRGKREAVTADFGTAQAVESPDGQFVYFRHRRAVWRVPVSGGKEEEVFTPEYPFWTSLQPVENGVYYLSREFGNRGAAVSFYDFPARQSSVVLGMRGRDPNAALSFAISPDRQYILYPQVDRGETNLMLVENFR
jgi:Tol biopolymer transport system component